MEPGLHYATLLPLAGLMLASLGLAASLARQPLATRLWKPTLLVITLGWPVYMAPFITLDFTLAEVARNSSSDLSLYLRLATSWSGGGSSLYSYATITALSLLFITRSQDTPPKLMLRGGFFLLTLTLAAALLNGAFDVVRGVGGLDLNPLLKSYWIIPHPLTTFGGYALIAVGTLAVLAGAGVRAQAILLTGWSLLTLGIAFGGYWSYETFGWGGYWAWDPVEVAELTVWLAATTVLHMQGPLSPIRPAFASLAVSSVPLALYVTRSGLSPLHSFAAANIGTLVLLAGSLVFLLYTLVLLSREGLGNKVVGGIRGAWRDRNIPLLSLTVAGFALIGMNLFVYSSLLTPSVLTAFGRSANIPTLAEGVRFYHPVLYPLAMILAVTLPGYFVTRLTGGLGYLSLLALALGLGGVSVAAVQGGLLTLSPLESKVTNMKIAFGVPLTAVMAGALLASLIHGLYNYRSGPHSRGLLVRDTSLKILHLGVLVTLAGIMLSGGYAFNDQYFQTYSIKPGQTIEFGSLEITLTSYKYYPGEGEVDLYSHVSGKKSTALATWRALDFLYTDMVSAISEIKLAGADTGAQSIAEALRRLMEQSGPLGEAWLNMTGQAGLTVENLLTGDAVLLFNNATVDLSIKEPSLLVDLTPVIQDTGELGGALLSLGVEGQSILLVTHPPLQALAAGPHSVYRLDFTQPLKVKAGGLTIVVEEALITPASREPGVNQPAAGAREDFLELAGYYLVISRGKVTQDGRTFEIPYQVGRGLYLLTMTQKGELTILRKVLDSGVINLLGNAEAVTLAKGTLPGEVALPRNALSGVRLAIDFTLRDRESGEQWVERALVRFEANGEAIGIHGLVSDALIIKKGLKDIYISIQAPLEEGFFNTYHELLVYYVKESMNRLPPEQALSLAGVMAAGYNIASLSSLSLDEAARIVEQGTVDLLLLADGFDPQNSTILSQGLPIMIKVVPNVNLLWLGVGLMSAAGLILGIGHAFSRRV